MPFSNRDDLRRCKRSLGMCPPTRTFEDHDRARHYESPAMSQFGNSGDKIAQTVAVARYILQQGFFSAT
jgi:hypothetical protein